MFQEMLEESIKLKNEGLKNYIDGNYEDAKKNFEESLVLIEDKIEENNKIIGDLYNMLGNTHLCIFSYKTAKKYHKKSLYLKEKNQEKDYISIATSYNNLGWAYLMEGSYKKALDTYRKAEKLQVEKIGEEHISFSNTQYNLGCLHLEIEDYDKASLYFNTSLEMKKNKYGEKHRIMAKEYCRQGDLYSKNNNYERAKENYEKSIKILEEIHNKGKHIELATVYYGVGNFYKKYKEYKEAEKNYKTALEISKDIKNYYFQAKVHSDLSLLYKDLKENENYIRHKDEAFKIRKTFLKENCSKEKIKSVESFLKICLKDRENERLAFRGQTNSSWLLCPSIFRNNMHQKENIIFKEILSKSPEFLDIKSTYEKLLKMQHYSFPTRLLDITSNPLIALYFSVESDDNVDGKVFVFEYPDENEVLYYDSDKLTMLSNLSKIKMPENPNYLIDKDQKWRKDLIRNIKEEKAYFEDEIVDKHLIRDYFVKGIESNSRISNQGGNFIIFGLNSHFGKERNFLEEEIHPFGKTIKYREYIVEKEKKDEIRKSLDKLNINESTVYSSLDRIANYIKNKYYEN